MMDDHRARIIALDGTYVFDSRSGFYEPEEERLERFPLWITALIWLGALGLCSAFAVGIGYCAFQAWQALAG